MLLGILGGCVADPPTATDPPFGFDIPGDWSADAMQSEPTVDAWWTLFQDEQLDAIIDESLSNNYDIAAAAARIEIAAAEARIAGADLFPQVSGEVAASRQRTNFTGSTLPGLGSADPVPVRTNSFGVSLDVSWELDVWGRIRSGASSAAADFQAAQADFAGARLSVAGQTAKAWLAVAEAGQQVELATATVNSFEATARQATNRVNAGVQPPSDMHLARSNLASARGLLQDRERTLDAARRQLESLLGRYPAGRIDAVRLPGVPPPPPVGLPAEIIQRRPDLVAAERRLASALKRTDAAEAALYPRLSLTASGGTSTDEFRDLLSGDRLVWTIAGNLVQPIFEGGRLRARVQSAEGRTAEARAQFGQSVLDAFVEVESSLRADALLAARERALAEATDQARSAVEVSQNRYSQGIETFIVVLESQRRALDNESALISVRRLRLENRVNLHLALGGGFGESMPEIEYPAEATTQHEVMP